MKRVEKKEIKMRAQILNKQEAKKEVKKMKIGWPSARAEKIDENEYIIVTHKKGCKCGFCPVLREDGFVN